MAAAERRDDVARLHPALGQEHERVVDEVRRLAGEELPGAGPVRAGGLGRRVVLGGEQDLGRLLGDLAADRIDAAIEQLGVYEPCRPLGGARRDRRPERLEPAEALGRSARLGAPSGSKQLRVPRWQVGPTGSTVSSSASASQSSARSTSRSTLPLVSPLRQSLSRDREWKWTSPVAERRRERLGVHPGRASAPGRRRRPGRSPATRPSAPIGRSVASRPAATGGHAAASARAGPATRPRPSPP